MAGKVLFSGADVVNEGRVFRADVLVEDGRIRAVGELVDQEGVERVDAQGCWLMPGCIDDQVHFREPGLTHKGELATESRAAAAGGITSFMEMPNTVPNTLTQQLLQEKYDRAAEVSPVNYSFFMGASNDNLQEVLKTDPRRVCGVKIFMGSSTGNMLVDDEKVLEGIFRESPTLVAVHCEDEPRIRLRTAQAEAQWGVDIPMAQHPVIRDAEACYLSSSRAVEMAHKWGTQLHVLHISTERELALFRSGLALKDKKVTAEACIHHLWFTDADYARLGSLIKWNPAVKSAADRAAIRAALLDGTIDVVATDHAPHTLAEKGLKYRSAPSGGPLVQHALPAMIELVHQGVLPIERVAELMAHRVATLFRIEDRGFIAPGQWADLVLVEKDASWEVTADGLLYKCGWSPFEGVRFRSRVRETWVNGVKVWDGEKICGSAGARLSFHR
jgi:dihydroorotase